MNTFERFEKAWREVGGLGNPYEVLNRFKACYDQVDRGHHDWSHIVDSFGEIDEEVERIAENPARIVVAFAGHDAIYNVLQKDWINVEESADFTDQMLQEERVGFAERKGVRELILSTKHIIVPRTIDEELITDIDKAILGKPWDRYLRYVSGIRFEYRELCDEEFNIGRMKFLHSFLKRPRIFSQSCFYEKYEAQAQYNMQRELTTLTNIYYYTGLQY